MKRRTYQPTTSQALMRWQSPRLTRRAHVTLMVIITAVLIVAGVGAASALPSDGVAILVSAIWGWTLGCAALAYAQAVIYR